MEVGKETNPAEGESKKEACTVDSEVKNYQAEIVKGKGK
jgi:hypothetical protein